jgi:hypothetical protein
MVGNLNGLVFEFSNDPDESGIQMVNLCPEVEWSYFRIQFQNRSNLSGFQMVWILHNYNLNWTICPVFEWYKPYENRSGFQMVYAL